MNTPEHELLENELRRLKPAQTPEALMARLEAAVAPAPTATRAPRRIRIESTTQAWFGILRWLAPASAVALVALVSLRQMPQGVVPGGLQADQVQLSQKLVANYDAVGELPTGEPVRFRCREWTDTAVFHDSKRGVVVEQNTPRFEVIPVAFETY